MPRTVISTMNPGQVQKLFNSFDELDHVYYFDVTGQKTRMELSLVVEGNPTPFKLHLHGDNTWRMEVETQVEAP